MLKIFQVYDQDGNPQGGHIFEAPDPASLEISISRAPLPPGWRREEIENESQIIQAPIVITAEE